MQEAADKVGISRKSLDDYLMHLRYGRRFGFDFHTNKFYGMGHLRRFNRAARRALEEENALSMKSKIEAVVRGSRRAARDKKSVTLA